MSALTPDLASPPFGTPAVSGDRSEAGRARGRPVELTVDGRLAGERARHRPDQTAA